LVACTIVTLLFSVTACSEDQKRVNDSVEGSDSTDKGKKCTAGDERECECKSGEEGIQVCAENGNKWSKCKCDKNNEGSSDSDQDDEINDDSHSNSDSDTDSDGDTDSDSDTDGDSDIDTGSDTDSDTSSDNENDNEGPVASDVVEFGPNLRINDDSGNAVQTEVALATGPDGLVLAGWMDHRAERVCAFTFSTDGGETWSVNVSIPNISRLNFVGDPAVAIDGGGTMYAVCQQYQGSGYGMGQIRMMTSADKGQTWSEIRNIQAAQDKPWIVGGAEDGTIFLSWLGSPGGIKRSLDHGETWDPIQSTGRIIHGTGIASSETGLLHVPYNLDSNRNQLRYLRSKDNGASYEAPRDLVQDMGQFCFNCNPRQHPIVGAATDPTGQTVAITWTSQMPGGEGNDDVWILYSVDGGDSWTKPIRVNDNTVKSRQFESWVAVDAYGRVHVAWTDFRDGKNDTYYARSADPTQGFEPNVRVNDGSGRGNLDFLGDYKGIEVQGSDVLVVWQDTRNDDGDIYFARAVNAAGRPK
jgi:hypothetical protein